MQKQLILTAIGILVVALLVGCAHQKIQELDRVTIEESKKALMERVSQYWAAIVVGDSATQQSLMSPQYREQSLKLNPMGGNMQNFNIINYSIDAIEIDPDGLTATVVISNSFLVPPVPKPKIVVGQITRWELLDGTWYPQFGEVVTNISGARRKN